MVEETKVYWDQTETAFPIVGVGASAGGLEAFTSLLENLPDNTGMSFVLVQHLDPLHESELTRLLARATSMPTLQVTDNLVAQPNHVYVIPPNAGMSIVNGVLKLQPRPQGRLAYRSIDHFFESLAQDQRERAIGVILSGTANDGTLGLEAIKGEGGITFAQDETAKQDSMPQSAIAAGCADYVMSPKEIARELSRIAAHPYVSGATLKSEISETDAKRNRRSSKESERESAVSHPVNSTPMPSGGSGTPSMGARQARNETDRSPAPDWDDFKQVLSILHRHCGVDFSLYKSTTIQRRIARRMVLTRHDALSEYAALMKDNPTERDTLFSDLLISVTSFFRNPEAFEALKHRVFPRLIEQRTGEDSIRVWVLGCSTGQEAYSIAMAFAEFSDTLVRIPKLQIFATDLNEVLLDKARSGLYARTLAQDISPERLRRFFTEDHAGYRVIKPLREQIVFARQNLVSDPPFSRMDLISCRNLLIYLESGLQKKLIPTFHYALRSDGFLLLGASESIGHFTDLFEAADKKQKIFRKKQAPTRGFHLPLGGERSAYSHRGRAAAQKLRTEDGMISGELTAQREADRYTVNQFAPPSVLIDAEMQILQFRGATSAYLEPPTGRATFDLLKMARRRLILPLRTAINKAKKEGVVVRKENLLVNEADDSPQVHIQVVPLKNLKDPCFLVLFEPVQPAIKGSSPIATAMKPRRSRREETRHIAELERDLSELRDFQQAMQEQSEAVAEELQASNEEVQSANEELQSINEELETSKEELESTNEELTTVNEEMASRNIELHRLNSDLTNLQVNLQTVIVLLDRDLTIRRFTAPAEKLFNLVMTDIGRSFGTTQHHLVWQSTAVDAAIPDSERWARSQKLTPYPLESVIGEVIDSVSAREDEVQDRHGRWYSLWIRPYMTLDKKIDGAVVMLTDIDVLKRSEQEAKDALEYIQAIMRTARVPLLVLARDFVIKTANSAFSRTFKMPIEEAEGHSLLDLANGAWQIPALRNLFDSILPNNAALEDFEVTHKFPEIGTRTMLLNARYLRDGSTERALILLSIEDITERKRVEELLRDADRRKSEFLTMLAHELRNPLAAISNAAEILKLMPDNVMGVRRASEVMMRQSDQMIHLVNDLLDTSRIARGIVELHRQRIDIVESIQQVVDAAREVRKDRQIEYAAPAELIYVNADPVRLAQIFDNLLNNACKFTRENGHIWITVEREAQQICVRVRDDGIGMEPEQIPQIFDMFKQLDNSAARKSSGLGIGLALVRRLVEVQDGSVQASSAGNGLGSEFVVRFPVAE